MTAPQRSVLLAMDFQNGIAAFVKAGVLERARAATAGVERRPQHRE